MPGAIMSSTFVNGFDGGDGLAIRSRSSRSTGG